MLLLSLSLSPQWSLGVLWMFSSVRRRPHLEVGEQGRGLGLDNVHLLRDACQLCAHSFLKQVHLNRVKDRNPHTSTLTSHVLPLQRCESNNS